jgi:hypothetical protein
MADPAVTSDAVVNNLGSIIAAVAALGTASMGLVDALKALWGGPSNVGFGAIKTAVEPFLPVEPGADQAQPPAAEPAFNRTVLLQTLKANWINGVPKADQKAKAKALIHLGLSQGNAEDLASAAGVDPAKLKSVADKTASGTTATPDEINVLGQFDAIVSAVLDNAYERADQQYRNASKLLATLLSTALGAIGGALIGGNVWLGIIVGVVATPLAPVSKDLTTSLQAAVSAIQTVRRGVRR